MVFRGAIKDAVEEVALKQTDWFRASDIRKAVEEKSEQPVSVQRAGYYLGVVAKNYHFLMREDPLRGNEYLPRALILGRD